MIFYPVLEENFREAAILPFPGRQTIDVYGNSYAKEFRYEDEEGFVSQGYRSHGDNRVRHGGVLYF
jgi:hypothetical protein